MACFEADFRPTEVLGVFQRQEGAPGTRRRRFVLNTTMRYLLVSREVAVEAGTSDAAVSWEVGRASNVVVSDHHGDLKSGEGKIPCACVRDTRRLAQRVSRCSKLLLVVAA